MKESLVILELFISFSNDERKRDVEDKEGEGGRDKSVGEGKWKEGKREGKRGKEKEENDITTTTWKEKKESN